LGKRYNADIKFVVAMWEQLLATKWKDATCIIVVSDGYRRQ